jgi:hypothetical protein
MKRKKPKGEMIMNTIGIEPICHSDPFVVFEYFFILNPSIERSFVQLSITPPTKKTDLQIRKNNSHKRKKEAKQGKHYSTFLLLEPFLSNPRFRLSKCPEQKTIGPANSCVDSTIGQKKQRKKISHRVQLSTTFPHAVLSSLFLSLPGINNPPEPVLIFDFISCYCTILSNVYNCLFHISLTSRYSLFSFLPFLFFYAFFSSQQEKAC